MNPEFAPKAGGLGGLGGFDLKGPLAQFAMSMLQRSLQPQQQMPPPQIMGYRPQQPMGMLAPNIPQINPLGRMIHG